VRDVPCRRIPRPVLATLATLAVLMTAASAAAQSLPEPNTWSVTPFLHTSMGMGDPAPENSIGLGASVAYDWTRNLGFEGEIGHLFDVAGDTADVDWSITSFSANALYHFNTQYVTPYATFGLGVEHSGFEVKNPDSLALYPDLSATEFAFNFGGGVKYALNDRWHARADLRRFQANDVAPDYWRLYAGVTFKVK
jgi:opacity protein-like surface antigen